MCIKTAHTNQRVCVCVLINIKRLCTLNWGRTPTLFNALLSALIVLVTEVGKLSFNRAYHPKYYIWVNFRKRLECVSTCIFHGIPASLTGPTTWPPHTILVNDGPLYARWKIVCLSGCIIILGLHKIGPRLALRQAMLFCGVVNGPECFWLEPLPHL